MNLELKIIDLLSKNMEKRFTINEIAKNLGEYYSFVHKIANRLSKEDVLTKTKAGNSYLCSLNLSNEKTLVLIQLSEIKKREELYTDKALKLILDDFVKSHESLNKNIAAVVLFGSYAKGTATGESDIDILLIGKSAVGAEKITREIYAKYGKEISPIMMTATDFKKQKAEAVIREIIKNHYVLYGVDNFVKLVFEK